MSASPTTTLASTKEPDPGFVRRCLEAGVDEAHVPALWRLHLGGDGAKGWSVDDLLVEHGEWRTYCRSRTGDGAAARAFEKRWRGYVGAFFRGRASRDEVEEITARFFERVYRLVDDRFAWPCPFTVYLRAALVNLSRDAWQAQALHRDRMRSIEDVPSCRTITWKSREPSPEADVLSSERGGAVRRALRALSEEDRALVVATLVEGRSGDDLALALGLNRQAVYQRVHRAKARLRELLRREGTLDDVTQGTGGGGSSKRAASEEGLGS